MDIDDIYMNIISDEKLLSCENRIKSDISECKRSKLIGKICYININEYKKNNNGEFELIIEFISFFSVKFIFNSEYPISPPLIKFNDGDKIKNIFDNNGNALIETIKKENWNKGIWLSTLIYYIELLLFKETGRDLKISNDKIKNYIINKRKKYGKRNWNDYIKEVNKEYGNETPIELEINLKKLKDKEIFNF